ncbi:MAG: TonB-dependent receptor family protein [Gammaproteobacteria bacterium]
MTPWLPNLMPRLRRAWRDCLLIAVLVCCKGGAHAETESIVELPKVLVEGERPGPAATLPSLETARKRLERVPGGTDLIDAEIYRRGRASHLGDLLQWSPGVWVQPRFGADEARLSIRGSGLQRPIGLRGIKLLQDGVPIDHADGSAFFHALDPLATRYIEVYRGANALQYGATTLGGAINFVSPSGYDARPVSFRIEGGSFDYKQAQLALAGVRGTSDGFLSATYADQEGFRAHARHTRERLFANLGLRLSPALETRWFLHLNHSGSEFPGALTQAQLDADPGQANPLTEAGNQRLDLFQWRIANRTRFGDGPRWLELTVSYAYQDLDFPIVFVVDGVSQNYGADLRFVSEAPLQKRIRRLTLGLSIWQGDGEDDRFLNVAGRRGPALAKNHTNARNLDLYGELEFGLLPDLALLVGSQWSQALREVEDRFPTDGELHFDRTFTGLSPKLGLRYQPKPGLQVFANLSRSFEPPTLGELTEGLNVTPVDDQTATTVEVGTRGGTSDERLSWDLAYYHSWLDDELLSLTEARGEPLGTVNARDTVHQGIELGVDLRVIQRLSLNQTYTWNDFRFSQDPVFGNNRIAGIPEHAYRAELRYRWPQGYYFGPSLEWVPADYPVDHANTLFAQAYATVGVKAGYRREQGWAWFIEGKNLTDAHYAATTEVIADARGRDAPLFFPGDGIAAFAGVEWRW